MKELTLLAEEKGFKSKFLSHKPYKYSTNEGLRQLFLLVEIQKWLRDVHNIYANAEMYYETSYISVLKYKSSNEIFYSVKNLWTEEFVDCSPKKFFDYEDCLKTAVYKGLEMIGGKTNE